MCYCMVTIKRKGVLFITCDCKWSFTEQQVSLFTEEILRTKVSVVLGTVFQLMVKDFTLNKYIFVMGVINSMLTAWRWLIKTAIVPVISNTPAILINNNLVPILDASSNHISWSVLAKNQTVIFLCNINPNFGISLQIVKPYCIYEQETF